MNISSLKLHIDGDKLTIQTDVNVTVEKKEKNWIAFSPDFKTLGISSEGKGEALADLKKSLEVFFRVHLKRGTLDETLANFKWEKVDHTYIGPPRFTLDQPSESIKDEFEVNC